jgi:hypothetical protein
MVRNPYKRPTTLFWNAAYGQKTVQTAYHLMLECSLWSKDRTNSPPPYAGMQLMVKRPPISSQISPPTSGSAVPHNTVSITSFLRRIFQALQEDAQGN